MPIGGPLCFLSAPHGNAIWPPTSLYDSGGDTSGALSLRMIAQELAAAGLLNERGSEYNPNAIKRMVER